MDTIDTIDTIASRGTHLGAFGKYRDRFFSCYEKRSKTIPMDSTYTIGFEFSEIERGAFTIDGYLRHHR